MRGWNRYRKCGCYLDPGEGTICEDCQKAQKKDVKIYVEPVHIPVKNPRQQ